MLAPSDLLSLKPEHINQLSSHTGDNHIVAIVYIHW